MYDIINGGVTDAELVSANMGANPVTGSWRSMQKARRRLVLLAMAAGASGNTPTFTLEQATDGAGAGAKVLPLKKVYVKVAAGKWEKVEGITSQEPVANYDSSAANNGTAVIQIGAIVEARDLDDGFTHVRINTPAVGGTRTGTVFHVVPERDYQGLPGDGE